MVLVSGRKNMRENNNQDILCDEQDLKEHSICFTGYNVFRVVVQRWQNYSSILYVALMGSMV